MKKKSVGKIFKFATNQTKFNNNGIFIYLPKDKKLIKLKLRKKIQGLGEW